MLNIQHVIEKGKGAACLLPDPGMIKGRSFSGITDRKGIVKAALKKESPHKEPLLKPLLKAGSEMQLLHQLLRGVYTLKHSLNCVLPGWQLPSLGQAVCVCVSVLGLSNRCQPIQGYISAAGGAQRCTNFTPCSLFATHLQLNPLCRDSSK